MLFQVGSVVPVNSAVIHRRFLKTGKSNSRLLVVEDRTARDASSDD